MGILSQRYRLLALSVLVLLGTCYMCRHPELLLGVRNASTWLVGLLGITVSMMHVINGYRFRALMAVFGVGLPHVEAFGLSVCNVMLNHYLTGTGGLLARAYYIKRKYGVGCSESMSVVLASQVLGCLLSVTLGLLLTVLYWAIHRTLHAELLGLFGMLGGLSVAVALVATSSLRAGKLVRNAKVRGMLESAENGVRLLRRDRHAIAWFSGLYVAGIVLLGVRLFVAFSAVGVPLSPLQALIIPCLITFSMILPLTPANFGVNEGIVAGVAYLFGIPADQALLAALLDRAVAVAIALVLGLIFSHVLLSDMTPLEQKS